jgi:2-oxoglutarate ferredoxin oxidoreductase subunit gamma
MYQIKLTGSGGQGIIIAGEILAYAAVLDGKEGSAISSYGSAARGGMTTSEVIIDDKFIAAPFAEKPDYIIALSQSSYNEIIKLQPTSSLPTYIIDSSIIVPNPDLPNQLQIPATEIASKDLKSIVSANMIILGFFAGYTKILKKESFVSAIKKQVLEKYVGINIKAFEIGYEQGLKVTNNSNGSK